MHIPTEIGRHFEDFLHSLFPDLINCTAEDNVPDFYCSTEGFWIEAKVGYMGWGCRVKEYQVKPFKDFKEPVVHALGMHDLYGTSKLPHKTTWGLHNYFNRHMVFTSINFISGTMMEKLWAKEMQWNKKETMEYCMIKPSLLRNIMLDRGFSRNNVRIDSAEEYYGFSRDDYYFSGAVNATSLPLDFSLMLEKGRDDCVKDYFERQEVVGDAIDSIVGADS